MADRREREILRRVAAGDRDGAVGQLVRLGWDLDRAQRHVHGVAATDVLVRRNPNTGVHHLVAPTPRFGRMRWTLPTVCEDAGFPVRGTSLGDAAWAPRTVRLCLHCTARFEVETTQHVWSEAAIWASLRLFTCASNEHAWEVHDRETATARQNGRDLYYERCDLCLAERTIPENPPEVPATAIPEPDAGSAWNPIPVPDPAPW